MNSVSKSFFFVLLLFQASSLFALGGKIAGRISDQETGAPIIGANIIVESYWENNQVFELSVKQGAASDKDGYYFILDVRPGTYSVKAMMIGYKPMLIEQVRVNSDRTIRLDFLLESTVLELGTVEVTAHREVIKADVSGTQETILTERITEAPILRMDEFVNKVKGVDLVTDNDGNGLSIRGGSVRETDVRIDGISARDPRSGNSYLSLNSTSIEELQVLTGGFEAKYGGFKSGLVNVVTKEGRRDKYNLSLKVDMTSKSDYKFFGSNPWGNDSWMAKVYADTNFTYFDPSDSLYHVYCWEGVPDDELLPTGFPSELKGFKGWNNSREGRKNYQVIGLPANARLTPEQKRAIWLVQHPQYEFAQRPDVYIEGTLTGPVPGKGLPFIGNTIGKSTFLAAGKYENTQFAFPIGPRRSYTDYNGQIKLSSYLSPNTKMSMNGFYAKVETNTGNRPTGMGGALLDYSSKFNFMSSSQSSVEQLARILGSSNGFINMFNQSQMQYLDQRWFMGGMKLNHTLSSKAFFNLETQFTYQDSDINPYSADTSLASAWVEIDSALKIVRYPSIGTPYGSTNWSYDITDLFQMYGGLQQVDSSYSWTLSMKGDLTAQLGHNHQFETGFVFQYSYSFVYSGAWMQSEKLYAPGIPDTWQYYKIRPVELGAYIQDKLEFEGMIASAGLRLDYFNPQSKVYPLEFPLDEDYANFYNQVYQYLPGEWGSYERWEVFREMLDSPPGWDGKRAKAQLKLSPRLGVSFPVTTRSKLYFNYGHFYQKPNMSFLYNLGVATGAAILPSTDLEMGRTVAYEFGYEQQFLESLLFNVTLYYKDLKNEPLSRTFWDYYQEFTVSRYYPDAYADIRGIELRLERNYGRFLTFWANYEYMLKSWGQVGLKTVYENQVEAQDELRNADQDFLEPQPRANVNINFHTPSDWGIRMLGFKPLSKLYVNLLYDWRDGGKIVIQTDPLTGVQRKAEIVDFSNLDLRASKGFKVSNVNCELVLTVTNILNIKRFYINGMSTTQYNRYKESLCFPWESGEYKGNDKWGEYRPAGVEYDPLETLIDNDNPAYTAEEITQLNEEIMSRNEHRRETNAYIDQGWFTTPLFLNPRRVLIGLRINF